MPRNSQHGAGVSSETVRVGAAAQVDEADGGELGGAGDEEVRGDWGDGVRVDRGVEGEGGGGEEGEGGVEG